LVLNILRFDSLSINHGLILKQTHFSLLAKPNR